ncbi:MAG: carbohydrate-binding family 9-like protein [Acidobacteria bacterium]|nr:carbohydrate-binding family 9-like protein [Acidobacteriota bacterium]
MINSILCPRVPGGPSPFWTMRHAPRGALIDRYWDGRRAGPDLATEVRCAWDETSLCFQFLAPYQDLNVNQMWASDESVCGLWEGDVVEVFLRPEISQAYFEFEVSPLGQWLDALIRQPHSDVDFAWRSEMKVRCEIEPQHRTWTAELILPFQAMGAALQVDLQPAPGDVWKVNLFRIAGFEPARAYLAWQPTFTPRPDFHLPQAFGNLILLG